VRGFFPGCKTLSSGEIETVYRQYTAAYCAPDVYTFNKAIGVKVHNWGYQEPCPSSQEISHQER
jgi:hypothetical protein